MTEPALPQTAIILPFRRPRHRRRDIYLPLRENRAAMPDLCRDNEYGEGHCWHRERGLTICCWCGVTE